MKIAVTYDNGEIFQHFGHTEQFKLYDIENGKVVASEVGGCSGNADQAVEALLEGQLNYDADVKCSHHDHEHGESGHQCGNHGCGSHSCH